MNSNVQDVYLEERILAASPIQLIVILYDAALDSVKQAQYFVSAGDLQKSTRHISKAHEIVSQLRLALHQEMDAEVVRNLADLYAFVHQQLLQASQDAGSSAKILGDVQQILTTLASAWKELEQTVAQAPASSPYAFDAFEPGSRIQGVSMEQPEFSSRFSWKG